MKPVRGATVTTKGTGAASATNTATTTIALARPIVKTTLNDLAHTGNSDDDVNGFYASKVKEGKEQRR